MFNFVAILICLYLFFELYCFNIGFQKGPREFSEMNILPIKHIRYLADICSYLADICSYFADICSYFADICPYFLQSDKDIANTADQILDPAQTISHEIFAT